MKRLFSPVMFLCLFFSATACTQKPSPAEIEEASQHYENAIQVFDEKLTAVLEGPPAIVDIAAINAALDEANEAMLRAERIIYNVNFDRYVRHSPRYILASSLLPMLDKSYKEAETEEQKAIWRAVLQQVMTAENLVPADSIYFWIKDWIFNSTPQNVTSADISTLLVEALYARVDEAEAPYKAAMYLDLYAYFLHLNNRTAEALPIQERAARLDPSNADITGHLAQYRALLQQPEPE